MHDDIVCFLKFGQREHMERLRDGHIFFTNAETVREIERKQNITGQGDCLEGGSILCAQNIKMVNRETGKTMANGLEGNFYLYFEPLNKTPLFCLFACYSKDCNILSDGEFEFHIDEKMQKSIRKDFPKADSVAIIPNPVGFTKDVSSRFGECCIADVIHYFHLKGLHRGEQVVNDMEYLKFITQDSSTSTPTKKTFLAKYAYRALFCKDVDFSDEQEFRIVLNNMEIDEPKEFDVQISQQIEIRPLSSVLPLAIS